MISSEGIILQTIDFKDYDQILTLFSLHHGIVKLVAKSARRRTSAPLSTLARVEFSFTKGNSDLWRCHEISVVDANIHLRETLSRLQAGCEMVQALLSTQMLQNPSPQLYLLSLRYLEKIPEMKDPYTLSTSFLLKLLRHEGVLNVENDRGCFTDAEIVLTTHLAQCSLFSELKELTLDADYRKKISQFFSQQIQ